MRSGTSRPNRTPFAAIVLAAGASTRMQGSPKALLPIDSEPAVQRILNVCEELEVAPVIVVAGRDSAPIRGALRGTAALVVENPSWSEGRTGSIQVGLGAVEDGVGALLWPIDHPFVQARTVEALVSRARSDAMALWVVPTFEGRGGHPIVLQPPTFAAISGLSRDTPLRNLLAEFGPQVLRVPVSDPGVTENVDTPETYRAALERYRREVPDPSWTGG
ncbi:MAG: nucleotidyltransferase family protein [Thermoplasmata archaeon]|nr:nucleotidyltransferase family protein [Thermoplasmata archaeon]